MIAPLQLRASLYRSIDIKPNLDQYIDGDNNVSLNIDVNVTNDESNDSFNVVLLVSNKETPANYPVTFDIAIEGNFTLNAELTEWDVNEKFKLLKRNGGSILYSQLREMFLYLSSMICGTGLQLPTVTPAVFDRSEEQIQE